MKRPKRIHAQNLSNLKMVAGMERKITRVIDGDALKEWVGIGWIELRKATPRDRRTYSQVKRDED